ncbi:MAG: carbohydrate binding family 9 domain-containing protein, partial [Pyrinomonadaceae bacterium]|nr:carbohydrate binding family 9 domain-containing protein [Pyrinomonadaceae bacterium]
MLSIIAKLLLLTAFVSTFSIAQDMESDVSADDNAALLEKRRKPVTVPKFSNSPTIDGKLDEEVWKQAAQFTDFVQTEPGDLIPPSKETIAYMGYDEKHLYIAFMCFDDPDQIRATVAKRDQVGSEDYVGVFLDTFDAQRKAYILLFNPYGIQGDGIKTVNDRRSDFSVDIVMESKGMILPNGWSVEVKIP